MERRRQGDKIHLHAGTESVLHNQNLRSSIACPLAARRKTGEEQAVSVTRRGGVSSTSPLAGERCRAGGERAPQVEACVPYRFRTSFSRRASSAASACSQLRKVTIFGT